MIFCKKFDSVNKRNPSYLTVPIDGSNINTGKSYAMSDKIKKNSYQTELCYKVKLNKDIYRFLYSSV